MSVRVFHSISNEPGSMEPGFLQSPAPCPGHRARVREAVFLLGARNVVHGQQCADWRQDIRREAQEVLRDVQTTGGSTTESPDVVADAVRVPVPLSCGQVMVSVPG